MVVYYCSYLYTMVEGLRTVKPLLSSELKMKPIFVGLQIKNNLN